MKQYPYKWATGSRMKGSAQVVGSELERLRKRHGALTAELVVKAARPASSPLHKYFPWNDKQAAHQRRLDVARELIRFVVITIERVNDEPLITRNFVRAEKGFQSVIKVMQQADSRALLLAQALAELEAFQAKYSHLIELEAVFTVVRETKARIKKAA